jgi:protein-tyrosine phosphatase
MVAQEVDSLREQRPGMVQREEQILLIYELLQKAFLDIPR